MSVKRPKLGEALSKWAYDTDEADAYIDHLISLLREARDAVSEHRTNYHSEPVSWCGDCDLLDRIDEVLEEA